MDYLDNENFYNLRDLVCAIAAGQNPDYISASILDLPVWGIMRLLDDKDDEGYEPLLKLVGTKYEPGFVFFINEPEAELFVDEFTKIYKAENRIYASKKTLKELSESLQVYLDQEKMPLLTFSIGDVNKNLDLKMFIDACSEILQRDARNALLMLIADVKNGADIDRTNILPFDAVVYIAGAENDSGEVFGVAEYEYDGDPLFQGREMGLKLFVDEMHALIHQDEGAISAYRPVRFGKDLSRLTSMMANLPKPGIEIIHSEGREFLTPEQYEELFKVYRELTTVKVGKRIVEDKRSIVLHPDEKLALEELIKNSDWIESYELAGGVLNQKSVEVVTILPKTNVHNLIMRLADFREHLAREIGEEFLAKLDDSITINNANRPLALNMVPAFSRLAVVHIPDGIHVLS